VGDFHLLFFASFLAHSELGQTRRFNVVRATSAFPPKACHKQTQALQAASFDYLIGTVPAHPLIAHTAICEPTRKQAKDLMRGVEGIC
jgi:hypothetical protein